MKKRMCQWVRKKANNWQTAASPWSMCITDPGMKRRYSPSIIPHLLWFSFFLHPPVLLILLGTQANAKKKKEKEEKGERSRHFSIPRSAQKIQPEEKGGKGGKRRFGLDFSTQLSRRGGGDVCLPRLTVLSQNSKIHASFKLHVSER